MSLWKHWLDAVSELRSACSRSHTFGWMLLTLVGLCCRSDNAGVTSFVRVLNFSGKSYHRFLHLFHSDALDLDLLTACWVRLCLRLFRPFLVGSHLALLMGVANSVKRKVLLVADAYYASGKVITPLLAQGHHLISRAKSNAVAYLPAPKVERRGKGRPPIYGEKVRLLDLAKDDGAFMSAPSPVYGENNVTLRYRVVDLI